MSPRGWSDEDIGKRNLVCFEEPIDCALLLQTESLIVRDWSHQHAKALAIWEASS